MAWNLKSNFFKKLAQTNSWRFGQRNCHGSPIGPETVNQFPVVHNTPLS
jgi:hypothetical protein